MASRILGIDLGAYSVKVAVANPGFRHAAMADFIERPVPPGEEPHEVRAARVVGAIIREKRLGDDTPYAAVSGDRVFIHVLEFPFKNLRRAELAKAVGTDLEGLLPVELEEMVYAFEPLPRDISVEPTGAAELGPPLGEGDDEPTFVQGQAPAPAPRVVHGRVAPPTEGMRVLACATRRDRARRLLELLGAQGAEPRGLIAAPASYMRVAERISACEASKSGGPYVAVVDVGHARTDVCVVIDDRADYVRTIGRGGRDLTQAIASAWKMPLEQAESAKHQDGFVASSQKRPPSEAWARISQVLEGELAPLARELRQTFNACRAKTGATVERVVLVGGGSRLNGLPEYLSEQIRMPVTTISGEDAERILGSRLVAAGAPADVACLSAGVAFEGAGGRPQFDLRQGELAYKADLSFLRAKAPQLAIAALAIIAFGVGSAWANFYKLRKAERTLDKRVALESTAAFGDELTPAEVLQRIRPSGPGEGGSPIPHMTSYDLLLALNEALPPEDEVKIDIEDLEIEPGKVRLKKAKSFKTDDATALDGIKKLEKSLEQSECFKQFEGGDSEPGPNNTREFSLTIKVGC